jgi:hypothetical protein
VCAVDEQTTEITVSSQDGRTIEPEDVLGPPSEAAVRE